MSSGFGEVDGQGQDFGPSSPGYNPDHLEGFEVEPLPPDHHVNYPGKVLGIVGLVLAIFLNIIGAIVSIIAYRISKKAGYANGWATAGIVVGFILFLVAGVVTGLLIGTGLSMIGAS